MSARRTIWDRTTATGTLADTVLPGLLVLINVTEVKAHGSGPKVRPLDVATGDVNESTEGTIVRITGTITQPIVNDLPFGFIISSTTVRVRSMSSSPPRPAST